MKIIHTVESYYPSVGGMQEVVKQLSERLYQLGHEVIVLTSYHSERKDQELNGVKIVSFKISGNYVAGIIGEVQKYQEYLLKANADIMANFAAQQWATDIILPILKNINCKKTFIPTGFSQLYNKEFSAYFSLMKTWIKEYDLNIFLSNNYRDINFARENNVENNKIIVIPNGAGKDAFLKKYDFSIRQLLGIPENHFLILHVGSHTGMKGHKEAIKIFKNAKIKNTTFLIIGNYYKNKNDQNRLLSYAKNILIKVKLYKNNNCSDFCKKEQIKANRNKSFKKSNKKLLILDLNRDQTIQAYQEADVFLFPSNIECSPIVLFECMASSTPFLASDAGNTSEIVDWSHAGVVLPSKRMKKEKAFNLIKVDIKKSEKILEHIYKNPDERKEMAEKGFNIWNNKFTWEYIAKQYEKEYLRMVSI